MEKTLIALSVISLIAWSGAYAQNTTLQQNSNCIELRKQLDSDRILLLALDSVITTLRIELIAADEKYVLAENSLRASQLQVRLLKEQADHRRQRLWRWVGIGTGSGFLLGVVVGILVVK